jgi:hypothetical protein
LDRRADPPLTSFPSKRSYLDDARFSIKKSPEANPSVTEMEYSIRQECLPSFIKRILQDFMGIDRYCPNQPFGGSSSPVASDERYPL